MSNGVQANEQPQTSLLEEETAERKSLSDAEEYFISHKEIMQPSFAEPCADQLNEHSQTSLLEEETAELKSLSNAEEHVISDKEVVQSSFAEHRAALLNEHPQTSLAEAEMAEYTALSDAEEHLKSEKEVVQPSLAEHRAAVRRILSEHVDRAVDAIVQQTMHSLVDAQQHVPPQLRMSREMVTETIQEDFASTDSYKVEEDGVVGAQIHVLQVPAPQSAHMPSMSRAVPKRQPRLREGKLVEKLASALPWQDMVARQESLDSDSHMVVLLDDSDDVAVAPLESAAAPMGGLRSTTAAARLGCNLRSETMAPMRTRLSQTEQGICVLTHIDEMKENLRVGIAEPEHDVEKYYWETGYCQAIARHWIFDFLTLAVIAFNCFWIWIDVDHNTAPSLVGAQPIFIAADNFFCLYFCTEWAIRFGAFRKKADCLRDFWFVFDTVLNIMIVVETWVLSAIVAIGDFHRDISSGAAIFKGIRLMRMSRMARLVRLLKAIPELMIVVTGLRAALRAVSATVVLMMIIIYVFAIFIRQTTDNTEVGNLRFQTVPQTMRYLLLSGTLPDQSDYANEIWDIGCTFFAVIYLAFAMIITITIMNMLVGVLVGVVQNVSDLEKEQLMVKFVRNTILKIIRDDDNNHMLSRNEFAQLVEEPSALKSFNRMGVDVVGLCDLADYIFADGRELPIQAFMELLMELRGSNVARVKDVVEMRKFFHLEMERFKEELEAFIEELHNAGPEKKTWRRTTTAAENVLSNLLASSDKTASDGMWPRKVQSDDALSTFISRTTKHHSDGVLSNVIHSYEPTETKAATKFNSDGVLSNFIHSPEPLETKAATKLYSDSLLSTCIPLKECSKNKDTADAPSSGSPEGAAANGRRLSTVSMTKKRRVSKGSRSGVGKKDGVQTEDEEF